MIYDVCSKAFRKFVKKPSDEDVIRRQSRQGTHPLNIFPGDIVELVLFYKREYETFEVKFPKICRSLYEISNAAIMLQSALPNLVWIPPDVLAPTIESSYMIDEMVNAMLAGFVGDEIIDDHPKVEQKIKRWNSYINDALMLHPNLPRLVLKIAKQFPWKSVEYLKTQLICRESREL